MAYPVVSRTTSALARPTCWAPSARRTSSTSTREAPSIRTSTGTPSAANTSDLQIWLSPQPIAAAASAAVRVSSGKRRTRSKTSAMPISRRASANRGWAPWPSMAVSALVMKGNLVVRVTRTRLFWAHAPGTRARPSPVAAGPPAQPLGDAREEVESR
ncbi:hypothetical protein SGLAM104S_07143 [Streptomyces glaucescens]